MSRVNLGSLLFTQLFPGYGASIYVNLSSCSIVSTCVVWVFFSLSLAEHLVHEITGQVLDHQRGQPTFN